MSYRSLALIALLPLALTADPARAQQVAPQLPPDAAFGSEITVTATGVESEVADVPAATTVITREQMDDAQSASVADLLRRVPGVAVVQSGDVGSLTSLFTRGTNSNHTLVLLDGVRLSSPYFGGYDWSLPTTTALERVEVARGPFSALWGSDAVGGVINLIPERRRDGFGGRLLGEGGEDGWERYEATVGFASKAFDIQASGYHRANDGVLDNGDATGEQGLATAGFSWGKGSRIGVIYQDLRSEIGIPFVSPGSPTPNRRQDTDQQLIAVPLAWTLSRSWRLDVVASRLEREIDFSDPDDPWGYVYSTTFADTDQARLASHHTIGDHQVSWGGEWRADTVSDLGPFGPNLDEAETETVSAFAQESWQISPELRVLAGLRWDDTDSYGSTTTGRLQLGWRLTDTLELRGGWGEAFRAPGLGELYGPFGGNPDLEAETSESAEIGLVLAPVDGHTRWQLNVFTTEIDNLVEFDFVTMTNANVGRAEIKGAELVWEQGRLDEVRWYLQASYLDTEGDDGLPLLRRPEWSASWTLNGELGRRWSGDVTVRWVDSRDDVDPVTYERVTSPSVTTVDLAIAWKPWRSLAITGRALNILDEEYEEVAGYPAPGRRFYAGLRWDL
ncbi:MAG: TonB-dependent receptor [Thermoanaerobaculales bacterium]|nr:TonB-dependent receptor [Thermoanaerobaculales bacterium]